MIDMRKKLKLEIPAYDKPVTYLPQVNYLQKVTFHINTLSDGKKHMSEEKLKQRANVFKTHLWPLNY